MHKLDLQKWERTEVFDFFSSFSDPFYMISFRQDVTKLYQYVKKNNLSFYLSLIYLCTQAFNSIDEFRLAIRGEDVVVLDSRNPSFTDLHKGSEVFHIVTVPMEKSIPEFCDSASKKSENQRSFIDFASESDELIYFSCVPTIDLTGCTNEMNLSSPDFKNDSCPRVTWGKFVEESGKMVLGMSLEVNHRLIDGIHIGKFSAALAELIDNLPL